LLKRQPEAQVVVNDIEINADKLAVERVGYATYKLIVQPLDNVRVRFHRSTPALLAGSLSPLGEAETVLRSMSASTSESL
jgi:hypothetical protein